MRVSIIAVAAVLGVLPGCARGEGPGAPGGGPGLTVVAGFYPLAEAARLVGGPDVDITNLTPAGAEAHDLELTPSQVDLVLDADLVVMLGRGFQPALEAAIESREGPTLELGGSPLPQPSEEGGAPQADEEPHGEEGDPDAGHDHGGVDDRDPHVWLDPRRFAAIVEEIGEALADLSSEPEAVRGRTQAYVEKLRELDVKFELGLKRCERREIVTTHAAFGYLAAAYRLRQEAIAGFDPGAEPDPARLAELTDHISTTGATTVFVEPRAPAGVAEVLAREAGVVTERLDPLESLTAEQLRRGADYEAVMLANLAALRKGLGCQ